MMDLAKLEAALAEFPLYAYSFLDTKSLEFSSRVRWICEHECPRYGKTWACPPGVGTVEQCREKCLSYNRCFLMGTISQTDGPYSMEKALATRAEHESITMHVAELFRKQGIAPYILSTEACALCESCAILENKPCRYPERMHPCVESHGINLIPTLESLGLEFQYSNDTITWYSLLFFHE